MFNHSSRGLIVQRKTAAYTVKRDDDIVLVNATSGAVTITLYSMQDGGEHCVAIQKTDATGNAVTVAVVGSYTINGSSTFSIPVQNNAATFVSLDTGNWIVVGRVA